MEDSVIRCIYDNLPCINIKEGFRCCWIVGRDGRILRMCRKFKQSKHYANRKKLIKEALAHDEKIERLKGLAA